MSIVRLFKTNTTLMFGQLLHRILVLVGFIVGVASLSLAGQSFAQESVHARSPRSGLARGTLEVSVASGYTHTYQRTDANVTNLKGVPVTIGGGVVVTDPIGSSWYRGQVTVGGEVQFNQYVEPLTTYLLALTPTLKYTFLVSDRVHLYIEGGAGFVWTDLGDRVPEQGSQFNFNLQVGTGFSYFVTPTTSINTSYRLQHISNARTAHPNHGIDAGVVLIGVSKYF